MPPYNGLVLAIVIILLLLILFAATGHLRF